MRWKPFQFGVNQCVGQRGAVRVLLGLDENPEKFSEYCRVFGTLR
jgi:hypothetical protein